MAHFHRFNQVKKRLSELHSSEKYIVGINISFGFHFQHIRGIYNQLKKYPEIHVVFIVPFRNPTDPKTYLLMRKIPREDIIPYSFLQSCKELSLFFTPCNSNYVPLHPSTIKVIYAHGLAGWGNGKSTLGIENILNYDYVFTTGPAQEQVITGFLKKHQPSILPKLVPVGYSISDPFFTKFKEFDREGYLKNIGLDPRKKTVIYAPSWGEESSGVSAGLKIISKLCISGRRNILVKLHSAQLFGRSRKKEFSVTGNIDWIQELDKFTQKFQCLRHIIDMGDFGHLYAADIMITDISGIGFEFLLLGKPVIYIDVPEYFKKYGKDGPEYWARTGIIVHGIDKIEMAIEECEKNHQLYANERKKIISKLIYNPGTASERVAREISAILKIPSMVDYG